MQIRQLFSGKCLGLACALFCWAALPALGQVQGCTDSLASNYNPAATINNGSCGYNPTPYTPPVKVDPLSDTLIETSGLQWAGGSLWSFNDGGGAAAIYRIDTLTNTILQRVYLQSAANIDWEDIAFDGDNFYIGDFGNNANGARTDLKIYKFPISAIPAFAANPVVQIPSTQIEVINFTYSNQPQPPQPIAANSTSFDCEAMLIDGGKIHLFSKDWITLNTTHYIINNLQAGTYTATPVDTLATNYLVTAADKAPGRNTIALLGYQNTGSALHFMHLLSGYSGGKYFNGNKRRIDLPDVLAMGRRKDWHFVRRATATSATKNLCGLLGRTRSPFRSGCGRLILALISAAAPTPLPAMVPGVMLLTGAVGLYHLLCCLRKAVLSLIRLPVPVFWICLIRCRLVCCLRWLPGNHFWCREI